MTGLMVGSVAALFLWHDHAFPLGTHQNFVFGFFKVLHFHRAGAAAGGHKSGFIAQVCQVGTRHTWRTTGDHARVNVLTEWDLAHVHVQDLFTAANIRQGYINLAVKSARTQQRRIQNVGAIGGRHHDHANIGFKAIHLNQHLVERLFTFVITAAQASTALTTDSINLVDKDDARRVFLGVVEHIAYAGRAHTDKHFHKIRA